MPKLGVYKYNLFTCYYYYFTSVALFLSHTQTASQQLSTAVGGVQRAADAHAGRTA